jgi:transmembrane sensor
MTDPVRQFPAALMEEAADWYWRIREDDISPSDVSEWHAWLAVSPDHQAAFDRIEQTLRGIGGISKLSWPTEEELIADRYDGSDSIEAWLRRGNAADSRQGGRRTSSRMPQLRGGWIAAAASIAVAVIAGVLLFGQGLDTGPEAEIIAYRTAPAEHREVTLPDGSTVALGGDTRISVAFDASERRVDLLAGEAFFAVATDTDRPFQVAATGRLIVALGTAFNVTRQAARVTLTVTEGEVMVKNGRANDRSGDRSGQSAAEPSVDERSAHVRAGQRIVFDRQSIAPIAFADPADAVAWRGGVLKYRGEQLRYVIEDVNRYSKRPIRIADEGAGDLLFTGTVFQDSADAWVFGLEDAFPVSVEASTVGIVISERR